MVGQCFVLERRGFSNKAGAEPSREGSGRRAGGGDRETARPCHERRGVVGERFELSPALKVLLSGGRSLPVFWDSD